MNSFSTSLTLFGLIPLGGLVAVGPILMANTFYGMMAGLITLGYTITALAWYVQTLINENDIGRLLGFSFACLVILLALNYGFGSGGGVTQTGSIFNRMKDWLYAQSGFTTKTYATLAMASMLMLASPMFQGNEVLFAVASTFSVFSSIFLAVPILLGVINLAMVLGTIFDLLKEEDRYGADFAKIQQGAKVYKYLRWFTLIYTILIFSAGMLGFGITLYKVFK